MIEKLVPFQVIVPVLGAMSLLIVQHVAHKLVRAMALLWSLIGLAITAIIAINFDWSTGGSFETLVTIPWAENLGLEFGFGYDSISLCLVMLTSLMMPLITIASWSAVVKRIAEFHIWLLMLEAAMIGVFLATDIIFFYVCFEFTLIPMFFLIGIWGSSRRLQAAKMFFLYTFAGSMITLVGIIYVAWFHANLHGGEWTFGIKALTASAQQMSYHEQFWVMMAFLAGFAPKVPLFPVHTWLPLAHTEAPMAGSVDLAAVLLKLGTYGILRFALPMCPLAAIVIAPYITVLAIIGILYTALICWVQSDIKKLVAYSSVSHMGFCVMGMFAFNATGVAGSVTYMINHGLSTGALFICIGMMYERFHTRDMNQMSGLIRAMPIWGGFTVFFTLASVGLPGLNGFISEFLCLVGAFTARDVLGPPYAIVAGIGMIFAAMYLLYMVGRVVFGPLKLPSTEQTDKGGHVIAPAAKIADLTPREIGTLIPLAVLCLYLGLYPKPLLQSLAAPIETLTRPVQTALEQQRAERANLEKDASNTNNPIETIDATDTIDAAMKFNVTPDNTMTIHTLSADATRFATPVASDTMTIQSVATHHIAGVSP